MTFLTLFQKGVEKGLQTEFLTKEKFQERLGEVFGKIRKISSRDNLKIFKEETDKPQFSVKQERVCSIKDRLGGGVIYCNNFDIFSFKNKENFKQG